MLLITSRRCKWWRHETSLEKTRSIKTKNPSCCERKKVFVVATTLDCFR